MSEILQPGESIKVEMPLNVAIKLLEDTFGIQAITCKKLDCYDDFNLHIQEWKVTDNINIGGEIEHGFVLKILNHKDSKEVKFIEAQNEMMELLNSQNIKCPSIVPNKCNNKLSIVIFDDEQLGFQLVDNHEEYEKYYIVRLFKFLPGITLGETVISTEQSYQCGLFLARITKVLQQYKNDSYKLRKTIWMLENVPQLDGFINYIPKEKQGLVKAVIEKFQNEVLRNSSSFQKGFVHGDFNDRNILVNPENGEISGLLDFGDSHYSYYLFDLAVGVTYQLLLSSNLLETYRYFISGYETIFPLKDSEHKLLKICIAARLCQSLILGAYSYANNPGNEYLLTTAKVGWKVLGDLLDMSEVTNQEMNI